MYTLLYKGGRFNIERLGDKCKGQINKRFMREGITTKASTQKGVDGLKRLKWKLIAFFFSKQYSTKGSGVAIHHYVHIEHD